LKHLVGLKKQNTAAQRTEYLETNRLRLNFHEEQLTLIFGHSTKNNLQQFHFRYLISVKTETKEQS